MLVCFAINERPMGYMATGRIRTFATSLDVRGPRTGMDSPANGT
jgi:hypothetical protein